MLTYRFKLEENTMGLRRVLADVVAVWESAMVPIDVHETRDSDRGAVGAGTKKKRVLE